jgi:predicted nuclease with TOPRIM domain
MIVTDNTKVNQTLLEENERLQGLYELSNKTIRDLIEENTILKSEINRILRACEKVEVAFNNIKKVTR